jgi:hypothetical protein
MAGWATMQHVPGDGGDVGFGATNERQAAVPRKS